MVFSLGRVATKGNFCVHASIHASTYCNIVNISKRRERHLGSLTVTLLITFLIALPTILLLVYSSLLSNTSCRELHRVKSLMHGTNKVVRSQLRSFVMAQKYVYKKFNRSFWLWLRRSKSLHSMPTKKTRRKQYFKEWRLLSLTIELLVEDLKI